MSDTQALLGKIAALRQRLEQTQALAGEVVGKPIPGPVGRLGMLEQLVQAGGEHHALLDSSIRKMADDAGAPGEAAALPVQLTGRARRTLERGRDLLRGLRALGEEFDLGAGAGAGIGPWAEDDPLPSIYRELAAMTETALRMIQALPDAPTAQLRLCEGLEGILGLLGQRLDTLGAVLLQRQQETDRVGELAALLTELEAGRSADVLGFVRLAEAVVAESQQAQPLRILHAPAEQPARFIACHSLNVAQVAARLARFDPELKTRQQEAVLAALTHDAGMLRVPAEMLAHPGPLEDEERRLVETHCRIGAELAARLLSNASWLIDAAACHHERLDGTGYPEGLRDMRLTSLTRLLMVCDVYAALCAPRPYRPARDPRTALTDTLLLAEQGALDRVHAERLLQLSFYPVGTVVELGDGAAGVVVAIHHHRRDLDAPARPVVAVLTDPHGHALPAPHYLDLAACEGQRIVRSLGEGERRHLLGRRYPEWA